MIVKNEAHVIRRCLDSVRAHVVHWVIVDTGSTDGTQAVIREHFRGVPGELHERPWRDFGHNRSEALELARGKAEYVLVMDADHALRVPDGYAFRDLAADGYMLSHRYAGTEYRLPILLADRIRWRYEGVLHEYVTPDTPHGFEPLAGPWIEVFHEGVLRSRDPETYRKDVAILETALAKDPGNARYAFYLAQSLRDAGDPVRARAAYRRRATMGGWEDERWYALYQAALLDERLGEPPGTVQHAYLTAYALRPARCGAARRTRALPQIARRVGARSPVRASRGRAARPADGLFIDDAAYAWRALDELAIAAWYVGARDEGRRAAQRLIAECRFPAAERAASRPTSRRTTRRGVEQDRRHATPARRRRSIIDRSGLRRRQWVRASRSGPFVNRRTRCRNSRMHATRSPTSSRRY
ncbi:MAG: glycosyltransferase [Comamonadaceae bacterium]|nr:glycosyltransferase [Comamonadaceae bacterium]